MLYRSATVLLLALLFIPLVGHAQEVVHRCVGNDGQVSFTDRACDVFQMRESAPPPGDSGSAGEKPVVAQSCARNRNDLLADVRNALETHDANRLASSYLWTGMGTREAYARMYRFRVVSARPLLDAQLSDENLPDQIRIDQLHSNANSEPETSYFSILTAAGCFWIRD